MCNACLRASRRQFLSLAAAAGAFAALAGPRRAFAKTELDADQALAKLKEGNERFVTAPQLCLTDPAAARKATAAAQSPWATIVTCADSRVAPETVFGGLETGELFVARNAGNIVDTNVMGTIEYGAEHLGSPLIVVMGHERCGACAAACEVVANNAQLPGSIGPMIDAIVPAAKSQYGKPGDFVENTVRENARLNAERIKTSPIVSHLSGVKVVYAYYDLDTGRVEYLG